MKPRKFVLGTFVLVFAVGSAVASSSFAPTLAHIKALTSGGWTCLQTDVECDTNPIGPECTIIVNGTLTARGYEMPNPNPTGPDDQCLNLLFQEEIGDQEYNNPDIIDVRP